MSVHTGYSPERKTGYFSYTQPVSGLKFFTVTTDLLLHLNKYGKNGFFIVLLEEKHTNEKHTSIFSSHSFVEI